MACQRWAIEMENALSFYYRSNYHKIHCQAFELKPALLKQESFPCIEATGGKLQAGQMGTESAESALHIQSC
jgi:hypothetical protein